MFLLAIILLDILLYICYTSIIGELLLSFRLSIYQLFLWFCSCFLQVKVSVYIYITLSVGGLLYSPKVVPAQCEAYRAGG